MKRPNRVCQGGWHKPFMSQEPRSCTTASDSGFTLMEVLVALAILAMSLGVLLGIFSQALDRVREGQIKASANNLAKTLLLRAETADPSEIKDAGGVSDPELRWRIHVQDYGSEQDRTNWPQRAVQVSTIVSVGGSWTGPLHHAFHNAVAAEKYKK